jgi:hypothetical protein
MTIAAILYLGYALTVGIVFYIDHKRDLSDLDD